MMLNRILTKLSVVFFLVTFAFPMVTEAQYKLRERTKGMETTDDSRRIPIPPRDRSNDPILVLRGGTLIDGTGAAPISNAVLVMKGDLILDVGPADSVEIPKEGETIEVDGLYIVPGLIDLHLHFTQQHGEDFGMYRDSDAAAAIRGIKLLGYLLDGGITAVRDCGTRNDVALKVKEAVERRLFDGPRVFWSGRFVTAQGSHADEVTSTATGRPKSLEHSARVAAGPWDWRNGVREQIRLQADWVKLGAPYTREEVTAAVDEAHMRGIPIMVDAFGDYITWAAEAGMDSIEHPLAVSEEALRAMVENGTAFVPTAVAFYNVLHFGYPSAGIPAGGFYYTLSRRFYLSDETILTAMKRAREIGVKVGIGTDIPFENEKRYPSDYFVEIELFQKAGYSNEEILASATRVGGEILKLEDKLGTLEKGKLADVLVVAENPLDDIQNLQKMRLVIADGRVVRNKLKP